MKNGRQSSSGRSGQGRAARHHELDVWVRKIGIPAMDAIRSATYWPSVLMKVSKGRGDRERRKVRRHHRSEGDVLEHIDLLSRVDLVMKRGKRIK
jgi:hypothetical protein